jgi:hypothetical protein
MKAVALAVFAITASGENAGTVVLKPGITLRLGENSSARITNSGIEILTGSAFVTSDTNKNSITVLCENVVTLSTAGVYRFDARPAWATSNVCRLKVYQGAADVRLLTINAPALAGEMMNMSHACADMIPLLEFDPADADRLEETGHFRSGWIIANHRR